MNCEEARVAYLAGDADRSSALHVEGCAACRSRIDDLERAGTLLDDPALWEEPAPELEGQVIGLISAGRREEAKPWLPRPLAAVGVAAAALAILGFGILNQVSRPDWVAEMPGTSEAPLAMSTVSGWNTDTGTRMLIEIEGLEPAPEGFLYEMWLSEGPIHISAGTFTGSGEVELWSGVRRADFPRLWVTLEPIDEDESPSRITVLDTGP